MKIIQFENNYELQANLFSFVIHLTLFIFMIFTIQWKSNIPYFAEVDLWDAIPTQVKIKKIALPIKKNIIQRKPPPEVNKKAEIDKLNQADSMIFQTEKQLKEFGDKLPEDVKSEIESLKDELIKAKEAKDLDLIDELTKKMNQVLSNASQASSDKPDSQNTSDEVEAEDVEFEEVN